MIATRRQLVLQLTAYRKKYPEEFGTVKRFVDLLQHHDAYLRTNLPGHITGSAFIISHDSVRTLLVHHAKLNKWLQPGGHADGDEDVIRVARREANEETGLEQLTLVSGDLFDIDIHPIPVRPDFPEHDHYDVRFLFAASPAEQIIVSEESHDVKWVQLKELDLYNQEESIQKMKRKVQKWHADR